MCQHTYHYNNRDKPKKKTLRYVVHSCSLESDFNHPGATLSTPNYLTSMRKYITRRAYFLSNTYDNRQKIHLLAKPFPMHITRHLGFGLAVHQALVIINSLDMYTLGIQRRGASIQIPNF